MQIGLRAKWRGLMMRLTRFVFKGESRRQDLNLVLKMVDLMGLAAGLERLQLAAAHHSQKKAAFPGLQTGPVKGMGI
jgi:hypothetical protein